MPISYIVLITYVQHSCVGIRFEQIGEAEESRPTTGKEVERDGGRGKRGPF
jgi:hypothetical protein